MKVWQKSTVSSLGQIPHILTKYKIIKYYFIDCGILCLPNCSQGVKRTVEDIENKKIDLTVRLAAQNEENTKAKQVYRTFMDNYNSVCRHLITEPNFLKKLFFRLHRFSLSNWLINIWKLRFSSTRSSPAWKSTWKVWGKWGRICHPRKNTCKPTRKTWMTYR